VLNLWHAYIRAAQVGWDANVVVAMRLMRLTVGGALAQREAQRMVAEKVTAIAEAQAAAITKMIMGGGMAAATKSASAVYQRKVRADSRARLFDRRLSGNFYGCMRLISGTK
jgi:hypothetical protein